MHAFVYEHVHAFASKRAGACVSACACTAAETTKDANSVGLWLQATYTRVACMYDCICMRVNTCTEICTSMHAVLYE